MVADAESVTRRLMSLTRSNQLLPVACAAMRFALLSMAWLLLQMAGGAAPAAAMLLVFLIVSQAIWQI
jgi:CHASE2 domain-containing sensor protein